MKKTLIAILALGGIAFGGEQAITLGGNVITESGVVIGSQNHTNSATTSNNSVSAAFNVMSEIVTEDDQWYSNTNFSDVGGITKVANAATIVTDGPTSSSHVKWAAFGYTLTSSVLGQIADNSSITLSFDLCVSGGNNNRKDQAIKITLLSSEGNSAPVDYFNPQGKDTPGTQAVLTLSSDIVANLRATGQSQKLIFYFEDTQDINGSNEAWTMQNMVLKYTTTDAPVPEPATGSLSLLALAGLCVRRRKK